MPTETTEKILGSGIDAELEHFEHGTTLTSTAKEEGKTEETKTEETKVEEKILPKLEDFGKLLGETSSITKKLDEGKKIEEKVDDKKEETPKEDEVVKETPDDKGKPARDLTGFGERESKWLQRMPYDAYEYFSKTLKDSRAVEEKHKKEKDDYEAKIKTLQEEGGVELPESYYHNPNAVVLSKDYQDCQSAINDSQLCEQHWKIQLNRIEKGEPWYDLVQDPKTGKIYVEKESKEPTVDNKVQVMSYFNQVGNQTQRLIGRLNTIVDTFKDKSVEFQNKIRGAEKQYMPVFENTKGDEYKLFEQVAEQLPSIGIDKDNPAFAMLAKSCALNLILKDLILKGSSGTANNQRSKESFEEEKRKAGPSSKQTTGGGGGGKGNTTAPTLEDFKKFGLPNMI